MPQRFFREPNEPDSNSLLLGWVEQGDYAAYTKIYELYYKKIFLFAWKFSGSVSEAEDIVQEVFLLLIEKKKSFAKVQKPEKYLIGIAVNLIKEKHKSKGFDFNYNIPLEEAEVAELQSEHSPLAELIFKEHEQQWWEIVKRLKPNYKLVYLLNFAGFTNREIAEKLGITEKSAINIAHRSHKQVLHGFQKSLEGKNEEK